MTPREYLERLPHEPRCTWHPDNYFVPIGHDDVYPCNCPRREVLARWDEMERLVTDFAKQKTAQELVDLGHEGGDFEDAYETMVRKARVAMTVLKERDDE